MNRVPLVPLAALLLSAAPTARAQCDDQTLTALDAAAGDHFGRGVAVHDLRAVIGAPDADTSVGSATGAAYFYERGGAGWVEQQKLAPLDLAAGDEFGLAVALDADFAVAGAPGQDVGGSDRGAAYVFQRVGGIWSQSAKLLAADGAAGDRFGIAVSLVGSRLLVGAPGDDDGASGAGSAYVFERSGANWVQVAKLTDPTPAADDSFGLALDLSPPRNLLTFTERFDFVSTGDCTGVAGLADWVSGCHNTPNQCSPAFKTSHNSGVVPTVTDPTGLAGSWFVYLCECARLYGCVRKIGSYDTLHGTFEAEQSWSLYVRPGDGTRFSEYFRLWFQDRTAQAPTVDGPVTHGFTWQWQGGVPVVVQQTPPGPLLDHAEEDVGGGWWRVSMTLHALGTTAIGHVSNPMFAATSPLGGTVDDVENQGIYVFGAQVEKGPVSTPYQPVLGGEDVSGRTAVIGALLDDTQANAAGAAHVREWTAAGWVEQTTLFASDAEALDRFGAAVAIDRRTILVGAPYEDEGGADAGAVYVFVMGTTGWSEVGKLIASDAVDGLRFGSSVALHRDLALVGARGADFSGAVYVLQRDPATDQWSEVEKRTQPGGPVAGNEYGLASAISRHDALAGAFRDDQAGNEAGAAEVGVVGDFATALCFCPGSTAPCGNPDASAGCANSTGSGALLTPACSPSEELDELVLTVTGLPAGALCMLEMGEAEATVPIVHDGVQCISTGATMTQGLWSFGLQTADATGVASFGPGIVLASRANPGFVEAWIGAGKTWYFQYTYFDPAGPCGTNRNYSNALAVTFSP